MRIKKIIENKGQIEIMGLAILVVLLVIILVVALNFSFKTNDTKADLRKSLIANNLLNAIIKEQGKINIKELINECYVEKKRNANNGQNCQKLQAEFNKIVNVVLGNMDYNIKIKTDDLDFFNQGSCQKGITSTPYRFKEKGTLFIANLILC